MIHNTVVAGCQCVGDVRSTVRLQDATLGVQPTHLITHFHHHLAIRQTLHDAADFANSLQSTHSHSLIMLSALLHCLVVAAAAAAAAMPRKTSPSANCCLLKSDWHN